MFKQGRRYQLATDVRNSLLDRRCKSGADRIAWKAGMVFFCQIRTVGASFQDRRRYGGDYVDLRHPDWAAFTAALIELPESTDDALSSRPGWGPEDAPAVIELLVRQGKLSLDDVRAAVSALE